MNLKEMVDKCAFALNYAPENSEYKDEIVRVLNDKYISLSMFRNWTFLLRKDDLDFKAKIEGSSLRTVECLVATNPYLITASSGTWDAEAEIEGQTLVVGSVERTIARRVSDTVLAVTEAYTANIIGIEDWSVQFRRYKYPQQATEVLDITSRSDDRGKLIYVDWRTEVESYLDRDTTGDPDWYIEDEHLMITPPELSPSAAAAGGTGSLTDGDTYQYCYTYLYEGMESPPSTIAEATADSAGRITVSGMADTTIDSFNTHKRKQLYRRNKSKNGRWEKIYTIVAATTSQIDDGSTAATVDEDNLFEAGPRPHFRAYTTAGSDLTVEVRYMKRPRRLQSDTDVPEWPPAYHDIIVHRALSDLCLAHGMPQASQLYYARATEMLSEMENRHLTRSDRRYIRRGFDKFRYREERWTDPVKS